MTWGNLPVHLCAIKLQTTLCGSNRFAILHLLLVLLFSSAYSKPSRIHWAPRRFLECKNSIESIPFFTMVYTSFLFICSAISSSTASPFFLLPFLVTFHSLIYDSHCLIISSCPERPLEARISFATNTPKEIKMEGVLSELLERTTRGSRSQEFNAEIK